jgi:hypothetical protein
MVCFFVVLSKRLLSKFLHIGGQRFKFHLLAYVGAIVQKLLHPKFYTAVQKPSIATPPPTTTVGNVPVIVGHIANVLPKAHRVIGFCACPYHFARLGVQNGVPVIAFAAVVKTDYVLHVYGVLLVNY